MHFQPGRGEPINDCRRQGRACASAAEIEPGPLRPGARKNRFTFIPITSPPGTPRLGVVPRPAGRGSRRGNRCAERLGPSTGFYGPDFWSKP